MSPVTRNRAKTRCGSPTVFITIRRPSPSPRPKGGFITDNRTSAHVKDSDYARSGYDRGHMAPNSAIARYFGEEAQHETFLLTNVCPQSPALNEKVWERLENDEKKYADAIGETWIIDGPIFGDLNGGTSTNHLASGIAVPSAFYKILPSMNTPASRAVFSVIMPQTVSGTELPQQFLSTVSEIEKETHLEFFGNSTRRRRPNSIKRPGRCGRRRSRGGHRFQGLFCLRCRFMVHPCSMPRTPSSSAAAHSPPRHWTMPQRTAIDHTAGDLLVSAAAGSGKTASFWPSRCAQLVCVDPPRGQARCGVDNLLVLTFTDAAKKANEMRWSRHRPALAQQTLQQQSHRRGICGERSVQAAARRGRHG